MRENNLRWLILLRATQWAPSGHVFQWSGGCPWSALRADGSFIHPTQAPGLFGLIGYSYGCNRHNCFLLPHIGDETEAFEHNRSWRVEANPLTVMDTSSSHETIIDQEFERGGSLSPGNTVAGYWKLEGNKPEISLQKPSFSKFTDTTPTRERDHGGCGVEEAFEKLDNLIGLDSIKTHLRKQIALNQLSASRGSSFPVSHHLAMIGPPGTGKSTVARLIGEIYAKRGIVRADRFLEVDRSSLVGQYIGQTAGKTAKVIEQARGGVLFVDEAYALENGSDRDFGRESIAILLKAMEDYRGDLVVILAGYPDEMQTLLQSNPGLDSRVPQRNRLFFPSYSEEEIVSIAQMIAKQGGYSLNDSACQRVGRASQEWAKEPGFGNARWVRDIVEGACLEHAFRTQGAQRPDFELREEDIVLPKLISPKSCGFS